MPDKRNIIEEAVGELKQLKSHALVNAKRALSEEMSADLKKAVSDAVNEELGGGGDPPSGYDPEKGDTREDGSEGDELEDEGDGPAIIEAGIDEDDMFEDDMDMDFDDDDEDFGGEDVEIEEEEDFDLGDDDEDDDMDMDLEDEDDDDVDINIDLEDDEEDECAYEASAEMQAEVRKLRKGLREANRRAVRAERAIEIMKETVEEVNLFNARLTGVQKLQNRVNLSETQRDRVVERFDECESISEVKRTYKALIEGFRTQKTRKRHKVNRDNVHPSSSEQLTESEGSYKRMQELAKLI